MRRINYHLPKPNTKVKIECVLSEKKDTDHLSNIEGGKNITDDPNSCNQWKCLINTGEVKTPFSEKKIKKFSSWNYLEVTTMGSWWNIKKNIKEEILEYQENVRNINSGEHSEIFFISWTLWVPFYVGNKTYHCLLWPSWMQRKSEYKAIISRTR